MPPAKGQVYTTGVKFVNVSNGTFRHESPEFLRFVPTRRFGTQINLDVGHVIVVMSAGEVVFFQIHLAILG